ncbi:hypothetical protein MKX08_008151 [Trichoderma sp. CBMAI-0020]|nr:hypothetical protein MKX08_008151 [Trichoderma sp. CBMAI-0020]
MSSSSACATYNGSNASQRTGVNSKKVQVFPQVPVHLTYNMDRFAQESGKKSDNGHSRPPLEFRRVETQTGSEARMQARLREFDEKFMKNSPNGQSTSANK